jgi:CoA:oxalate CoA-transferase
MKPLEGYLVLDFSQFLSGPSAALRMADLGARVIKIERPDSGDLCRKMTIKNLVINNESVLFHTINRNKESYSANLKDPADVHKVKQLIEKADVLIENFRPGTMEKLGLDYEAVKKINPRLVYASITGYGKKGPWERKPGQDLLVQSISGLPWLNGDDGQPPIPFGLSVADMFTGAHLTQGILSLLFRRGITGEGGLVEVSLLESILDMQFEVLTTHLNDGGKLPKRSSVNNAHAYLGAPYGIYQTKDGFIAIAMGSVVQLGTLIENEDLTQYTDSETWFEKRDEIKQILVNHLKTRTTQEWLDILEPADYWCADVFNWEKLMNHDGFKTLDMIQEVKRPGMQPIKTLRCPIRINGQKFKADIAAPMIGQNTKEIDEEFGILQNL